MTNSVILTVMLWYAGLAEPQSTRYLLQEFNSHDQCQEYIFKNKVTLVESLLAEMKQVGPLELESFEYYCQDKEFNEV